VICQAEQGLVVCGAVWLREPDWDENDRNAAHSV